MNDATRRAELALFSGPVSDKVASKRRSAEPAGRILPSLIEPPPADVVVEAEEAAPRRRGRKPGSKNKPKAAGLATGAPIEAAQPAEDLDDAPASLMSWPDEPDDQPEPAEAQFAPAVPADHPPQAAPRPDTVGAETRLRTRLRDRSLILARYVHGTTPAPGEGWTRRVRRGRSGGL